MSAFSFKTPILGFGATTVSTASTPFPLTSTGVNTGFNFAPNASLTNTQPGFGFGTPAVAAAPLVKSAFGGFGTTTTTSTAPLFGGGLNFSFGAGGTGATTTTTAAAPAFSFNFGGAGTGGTTGLGAGFGTGPTALGGFGVPALGLGSSLTTGQTQQQHVLLTTASALAMPQIYADERDTILAKWNQLQAFWGTGKGYYQQNTPPVTFEPQNPFCRFKAVCYSCLPTTKDRDGKVTLELNKKQSDIASQKQALIDSLHRIMGSKPTLAINVDSIRALSESKTEVVIWVVERVPNGPTRRITATELANYLVQNHIKTQLLSLGVSNVVAVKQVSDDQIKLYLETPPAGIDPLIWKQAKLDNPDNTKLLPVALVGFGQVYERLRKQADMTQQHQSTLNIFAENVAELQRKHSATQAKITEFKRRQRELGHRLLKVVTKQEAARRHGYAVQSDEEMFRAQLESIWAELNAPTQFRGRLNDLMAQMRILNQVIPSASDQQYAVDSTVQYDIQQFLKQQNEGLSHLIDVVKTNVDELKDIEKGLLENPPHRLR